MSRPVVKLKLDITSFEESAYGGVLQLAENRGVSFQSMALLGDTEEHRRLLYELNKTCSADIPARGKFFEYGEFCERRYGRGYDPKGVIIALQNGNWIGMTANSNWKKHNFIFNEMTGVLTPYRRVGIAIALKLHGIRYAKSLGVKFAYTVHDTENVAPIALNRRLGYVDAEWDRLID